MERVLLLVGLILSAVLAFVFLNDLQTVHWTEETAKQFWQTACFGYGFAVAAVLFGACFVLRTA